MTPSISNWHNNWRLRSNYCIDYFEEKNESYYMERIELYEKTCRIIWKNLSIVGRPESLKDITEK